jgi:hypothetical protein
VKEKRRKASGSLLVAAHSMVKRGGRKGTLSYFSPQKGELGKAMDRFRTVDTSSF